MNNSRKKLRMKQVAHECTRAQSSLCFVSNLPWLPTIGLYETDCKPAGQCSPRNEYGAY